MFAVLGRSRALFSLGRYADSLAGYQRVLENAPEMSDPDPRIGIGCCFWALGYKDDAQYAWQRALELNPESKVAITLLGLYHLNASNQCAPTDPKFQIEYKSAMQGHAQKAFKIDNNMPLVCSTFGTYFANAKNWKYADVVARRAVELTDINAIASDGWYLLGRAAHEEDDLARANDFYSRADQARGGDERGYIPAKFGVAQIKVLQNDMAGAKFRLEKIVQQTKNAEALSLLGALYAEEAFSPPPGSTPEEIRASARKAIATLESVRMAWKDPKKNLVPDSSILLKLSRLYEVENIERSFQCLQQVEEMELEDLPEELRPEDAEDEEAAKAVLRENLPPQLTNNLACFHYRAERFSQARELFQTAANACAKLSQKDAQVDTGALLTTISYNLARTNEAAGNVDEAKMIYESLLTRQPDYIDAKLRLTYISLRQNPGEEGPKALGKLYEADPTNMEVRALYGWYIRKAKKKTANVAEDQEQRHYKHTLQNHDKHDGYSLTGMGNLYLATAREMPRNNDQEKDKRKKMYERAIEFFDKAIQLDPNNAYAAQGIAIAMVEDKKDYATALQVFTKVKESIKDASVHINLGHINCELKQYSRGIENVRPLSPASHKHILTNTPSQYEAALAKDRSHDPQVLACLGRAWLLRGKQDKNASFLRTSLDYSQRALELAPDQLHFQFNVAFVQIQVAQLLYSLSETQRTLEEVEIAAKGLDEAIESFSAIAKSPNPPFPKGDIEQRANMGRNTMRKQLERAMQGQREYEEKNAERLRQAREVREAEVKRREEEKRKMEEEVEARKRKLLEERQKMQDRDRELAAARQEEEKRKEEDFSVDEETGEKRKRAKRAPIKRKKKGEVAESDVDGDGAGGDSPAPRNRRSRSGTQADSEEAPRKKKKRKLERRLPKEKESSKFKSKERIEDSDEDDDIPMLNDDLEDDVVPDAVEGNGDAEEDEEDEAPVSRRKTTRVVDEDEDEEEDNVVVPADVTNAVGDSSVGAAVNGPDDMDV